MSFLFVLVVVLTLVFAFTARGGVPPSLRWGAVALLVLFLAWLAAMVLLVGPAMRRGARR